MQLDHVSAKKFFVYDVTVWVCKIYMWSEKNWQHIFLKSLGVACSEKVITLLVIRVAHALYIYHHTITSIPAFGPNHYPRTNILYNCACTDSSMAMWNTSNSSSTQWPSRSVRDVTNSCRCLAAAKTHVIDVTARSATTPAVDFQSTAFWHQPIATIRGSAFCAIKKCKFCLTRVLIIVVA